MPKIIELNRGEVTTVHSGITATATSSAVYAENHNAVLVKFDITTGSGAWTMKVQGALESSGTFTDWYDNNGNLMSTGSISASRGQIFVGIPPYIKIVATEDSGTATVTVKVQPTTI